MFEEEYIEQFQKNVLNILKTFKLRSNKKSAYFKVYK